MEKQNSNGFKNSQRYQDWKVGDRILFQGKEGIIVKKPYYESTHRSGLFYADILWEDYEVAQHFMVCRNGMLWKPLEEVASAAWTGQEVITG